MGDDIEIPVIEITDGWTVDDIETEDDCDDAFALLTALAASIEAKVDEYEAMNLKGSPAHQRAKKALRYKKAALSIVAAKRGKIKRQQQDTEERRMLHYIRAHHHEIWAQAYAFVKLRVAPCPVCREGEG